MVTYSSKNEAFIDLMHRFPRGAEVGTSIGYATFSTSGSIKHQADFTVEAEQVWAVGDSNHVMGLVWSSTCQSCAAPFYQLSPTHPEDLRELCSFCACEKYTISDYADPVKFNKGVTPEGLQRRIKRRGNVEGIVLGVLKNFGAQANVDDVIEAAVSAMPEPEEGRRDTRRQSVIRAVYSLRKEKDGPVIHHKNTLSLR